MFFSLISSIDPDESTVVSNKVSVAQVSEHKLQHVISARRGEGGSYYWKEKYKLY